MTDDEVTDLMDKFHTLMIEFQGARSKKKRAEVQARMDAMPDIGLLMEMFGATTYDDLFEALTRGA